MTITLLDLSTGLFFLGVLMASYFLLISGLCQFKPPSLAIRLRLDRRFQLESLIILLEMDLTAIHAPTLQFSVRNISLLKRLIHSL